MTTTAKGFLVEAGGHRVRFTPDGEGYSVSGDGIPAGTALEREPGGAQALVLLVPGPGGPAEAGRVTSGTVLMADGRLWLLRTRAAEGGAEVTGWEVPGAYLTIEPGAGGWRVTATAAGEVMPQGAEVALLAAAALALEAVDARREHGSTAG